jgi:hypothetical protein
MMCDGLVGVAKVGGGSDQRAVYSKGGCLCESVSSGLHLILFQLHCAGDSCFNYFERAESYTEPATPAARPGREASNLVGFFHAWLYVTL